MTSFRTTPALGVWLIAAGVPPYTRLDMRVAWRRDPLALAAGAQNIGHPRQPEFIEGSGVQPVPYSPRALRKRQ